VTNRKVYKGKNNLFLMGKKFHKDGSDKFRVVSPSILEQIEFERIRLVGSPSYNLLNGHRTSYFLGLESF